MTSSDFYDIASLFMFLSGFVLGLGAVTVIDLHGFLGRKSTYWTEATTRTHKVTKPLIWAGITLSVLGGIIFYRNEDLQGIPLYHLIVAIILILNGQFLSFKVSPFLLRREKEGRSSELLPSNWQRNITISFIISFLGWWSALLMLVVFLLNK